VTARAPAEPACSFCMQTPPVSTKLIRGQGDATICGDCVLGCFSIMVHPKGPTPLVISREPRVCAWCDHAREDHLEDGRCSVAEPTGLGKLRCTCTGFGRRLDP
jgi:hypothetical protein